MLWKLGNCSRPPRSGPAASAVALEANNVSLNVAETRPAPSGQEAPSVESLSQIDAYWRAANYLSVGQIYLLANPLLREPLEPEQVKPRLLGHFGTTPGLNFLYVHLNCAIRMRDLNVVYVAGPGHGGPGARRERLSRRDLHGHLSARDT